MFVRMDIDEKRLFGHALTVGVAALVLGRGSVRTSPPLLLEGALAGRIARWDGHARAKAATSGLETPLTNGPLYSLRQAVWRLLSPEVRCIHEGRSSFYFFS